MVPEPTTEAAAAKVGHSAGATQRIRPICCLASLLRSPGAVPIPSQNFNSSGAALNFNRVRPVAPGNV